MFRVLFGYLVLWIVFRLLTYNPKRENDAEENLAQGVQKAGRHCNL
jgi:hypothetical protein